MGGHWKLVNFDNEITNSKELYDKNWRVNIPKAEEVMAMLHILTCMKNNVSSSTEG